MLRLALFSLFTLAAASTSALTFSDGHTRHMEEELFQTVSEFFTGEQREGDRVVFRTQPDTRTGQYFILTLDPSAAAMPAGMEILLDVLPANSREVARFRFTVTAPTQASRQLYLGLTGDDWPDRAVLPMAWRVQLRDGSAVAAEWTSFLWEMP